MSVTNHDPGQNPPGAVTPIPLPGAQAAVGPLPSGQLVGYVAGAVAHGTERVRRGGVLAAALATAAAGPVMAVDLLAGGQWPAAELTGMLVAAGATAWLARAARQRPPGRPGRSDLVVRTVPRRAFVLRPVSGGEVTCVVYGPLAQEAAWRHGDILRVTGHQRSGRFVGRRVDVLATPAGPIVRTTRARRITVLTTSPWVNRIAWSVTAAVAACTLAIAAIIIA